MKYVTNAWCTAASTLSKSGTYIALLGSYLALPHLTRPEVRIRHLPIRPIADQLPRDGVLAIRQPKRRRRCRPPRCTTAGDRVLLTEVLELASRHPHPIRVIQYFEDWEDGQGSS